MPGSTAHHLAQSLPPEVAGIDDLERRAFETELGALADQLRAAALAGSSLPEAVTDHASYPALAAMHTALRDAMLLEVPSDILPLVTSADPAGSGPALDAMARTLARRRRAPTDDALLAHFFVFEAARLRLLVAAWADPVFETLGGTEADLDRVADAAVRLLEGEAALAAADVRPMVLVHAAASMLFARWIADQAEALRHAGEDLREELRMQARLKSALRSLRLPESVLLENALADLLGEDRDDLSSLQRKHALALSELSRQAMDQRVSRTRRALANDPNRWPRRRSPALFDILRAAMAAAAPGHAPR